MWQWAMRPFTTIERSPSEILKSCRESSCRANGVSICAPPRLTSRMVIGWKTLTSPFSGDGTGTRSVSRLLSSGISVRRLYTKAQRGSTPGTRHPAPTTSIKMVSYGNRNISHDLQDLHRWPVGHLVVGRDLREPEPGEHR